MDAELIFPETGSPQGFSSLAMAKWDGKPEPIVRELLQNCLDAAREAGRERAEVWFTIGERPLADLPGIDAYRKAFVAACEERASAPGAGEKRSIKGIDGVLESERARLLFCRDNGIGLDPGGLDRVLTEGNTDKATGGGTTGVGHLTAFAASDLRYVLYAGRSRANGALRDAVSGHAVLASHRSPDSPDTGIGGDGYLLRPGQQSLFARGDKYPEHAPPLLANEMARIEDTGSVVCIAGFNDFRDDPAKAVGSLQRVAATHFLAAIALGEMVVHVRDADGAESVVNRAALTQILVRARDRRVRRDGSKGPPGQQAWRAWQVFDGGRELADVGVEGVRVWFRPRARDEGYDSRVQLYRDGMWITNAAPNLQTSDFGNTQPFDAVVLTERGDLYDLVRDAEGPEHLGLDRERIGGGGGEFPLEPLARPAGCHRRASARGRGRARAHQGVHARRLRHRPWGPVADGGAPAPLSPASRRQRPGRCYRSAERRGWWRPSRRPEPRTAPEAGPPPPSGAEARQRRARALVGAAAAQCEGRVRCLAGRLADDRARERAGHGGRARARAVGFGLDLREPPGPEVAGIAGDRASRGNGPRQRAGRDRAGRAPGGWNADHHADRTDHGPECGRGRRRAAQARGRR